MFNQRAMPRPPTLGAAARLAQPFRLPAQPFARQAHHSVKGTSFEPVAIDARLALNPTAQKQLEVSITS